MNSNRLFVIFSIAAVFTACSTDPVSPTGEIKFSRDIQPIFIQNCALPSCHASGNLNPDGLELTSWNSLMIRGYSVGAAIIPYNAFWSSLVSHINSDTNTSLVAEPRMPQYAPGISLGNPLPPNQIELIMRWIDEGAKNDDGTVGFGDARRKALTVIDLHTFTVAVTIQDVGLQPHGVAFTSDGHYAYVTCESLDPNNPYVHHPITQSIRPGTTAVIDAWNGHVKVKNIEMASFPAGVSITDN